MAHDNLDGIYSLPAGADLSASQFCAGVINTSGQIVLPAAGVVPDGRIDNAPVSGAQCRLIGKMGVVLKFKVGASAVTLGQKVCCDAAGKLVAGATGHIYLGKVLRAGAAGDIVEVFFRPGTFGVVP